MRQLLNRSGLLLASSFRFAKSGKQRFRITSIMLFKEFQERNEKFREHFAFSLIRGVYDT